MALYNKKRGPVSTNARHYISKDNTMHIQNKCPFSRFNLEQKLLTLIAAWLSASAVLNFLNRDDRSYFTLRHAGLEGFPGLLLLTVLLTGLFFFLMLPFHKKDPGADLSGRLLFFAWLLFASTLTLRMQGTLPAVTLLLVMLVSLVLARGILTSAANTRRPLDILLALCGVALTAWITAATPWSDLLADLTSQMPESLSAGIILPALLGYFGFVLILCHLLSSRPGLLKRPRTAAVIFAAAMLLQIWLISRITVARYVGLTTPTYDFNLFVQMFHNMAESFQPITTLERNMPLSHFKVHVSPIYYLMLPFYMLFPDPATLQVLQAIVVGSGIIPLVLLARALKLGVRMQIAFSIIYLVSPALIASNFYDLHENCFLAPMVLWLIYFLEKNHRPGIALFTLLTLAIKEDAAIYIWTLALFFMLDRRMIRTGLAMFLAAGGWFIAAITWLQAFGDGAMTGRFASLIGIKEWSLLAVPYSVLRNPGFIFSKLFMPEKFTYILQMLAPLAFTPLFSRKLSRWILLIPFLLMNLMVDYQYQYNIRFQYNYGSYVILLYMALLFFKDLAEDRAPAESLTEKAQSPDRKDTGNPPDLTAAESAEEPAQAVEGKAAAADTGSHEKSRQADTPGSGRTSRPGPVATALLILAMTAGAFFSAIQLIDYDFYPQYVRTEQAAIQSIKESLDEIPTDSSVIATTFLTGYLGQRETIYDLEYNLSGTEYYPADYVVIDLRPGYAVHREKASIYRNDGYRTLIEKPDEVLILLAPWN